MKDLKKISQRIKGSKEAKVLFSNFSWLAVLKIVGYIFPLITLPYLSRVIGVDGFGEIAYAMSIIVFIETFTDFGFNYTATRDVARVRDNIKEVSIIFSNVFWSKLLLMIIGFLILCLLICFIPQFNRSKLILFLTFLYIPGHILFPEWFFQAMEKMKYITILNVISKVLFTLLIFLFIKEKNDYVWQPLLTAIGYWVCGIVAMWYIIFKFKIKIFPPSLIEIYASIKNSWNMFITLVCPNLYTSLPVMYLRNIGGEIAVGFYSAGERFYAIINHLFQILSRTFYPFLSRKIKYHKVYVLISLISSLLSSTVMFFGADLFVKFFYTIEFSNSIKVIQILALSPIAFFFINTYGVNYLVLIGKEKLYKNIMIFYSLLGMIIAIFLTKQYSYIGMTSAMVATRLLNGFTIFIFSQKYKMNKENV